MLLELPRDGDRVEVITSPSQDNVRNIYDLKQSKTTQDVVTDKVTTTSSQGSQNQSFTNVSSSGYTTTTSEDRPSEAHPSLLQEAKKVLPSGKAEIVPGSVKVSPLRQMDGVMIDLVVMIKMKSGGSRSVSMQIECPRFQPKRIRIDNVWHSIV
ncbi:hypothetical protein DICVIV_02410 [Dictyocaulus viviparus]|uniref:Uncharacterized protein n=1 Tax=Dictyocaulus viviparus TaxID=29172 RepID=A0A0D8YA02_DICVI|nr:hypothetical protein DICVIV_02410 [Dictyocaulus viviparus]